MISNMQNRLQDLALSAILEFEAIPGLSRGGKHLTRSTSVTSATTPVEESPDALQKQLSDFYRCLHLLGVDRPVCIQVYKQVKILKSLSFDSSVRFLEFSFLF